MVGSEKINGKNSAPVKGSDLVIADGGFGFATLNGKIIVFKVGNMPNGATPIIINKYPTKGLFESTSEPFMTITFNPDRTETSHSLESEGWLVETYYLTLH